MYFKEEEGDMIRKAMAANPKLVVQVGLQRRSSVLYQVAMEMIRKGRAGQNHVRARPMAPQQQLAPARARPQV